MRYLYILLLVTLSTFSYANYEANVSYEGWITKDGKRVQNTDNMKSIKGFGGWLIITPDKNWAEKWETPSHTTPYFSEAKEVKYGQQLTILTFYINPLVDKSGNVNIICGIKVTRPDKTVSIDEQNIKCINGNFPGNPRSVYLSPVVIKYSGDAGDPPGKWLVEVNILDKNRNAHVYLKSHFTLVKKANKH
ncbi:MAG: hypothetical protein ACC657_18480 [Thiohalomonadales bacterium]